MNKIVEMIKEQLGEGYSVEAVSVAGNNGSVKNGYCIRKDGENVAPNVYPDDWLSDEETVKQVLDIYKNSAKTGIELGDVFNPKYVLDNVIPVLINKERNADLLEQVINRDFMDLAIVYRVNVKNKDIGTGTYLLHNTHLESLGLSEDDLYNASIKNIASNYRDKYAGNIAGLIG